MMRSDIIMAANDEMNGWGHIGDHWAATGLYGRTHPNTINTFSKGLLDARAHQGWALEDLHDVKGRSTITLAGN
jgi:hypothetical protein